MGAMGRVWAIVMSQQGHFFPWAPVCLGLGIACYFSLGFEPDPRVIWSLCVVAVLCAGLGLWRRVPYLLRLMLWAAALAAIGMTLASWRTEAVAGPVLKGPKYGPVTGRIVMIDRSASGSVRITLDQVRLTRIAPAQIPRRVRITLTGEGPHTALLPGRVVATTAFLSPPRGAAEPGGFDFRRHAWFQSLGAIGYTRVPVVAVEHSGARGFALWITKVRLALSARIQREVPGPNGGVVAAIVTGDRSALDPDVVQDLRATNLAHLLAISGLHMGLAAGVVFGFVRWSLVLIPWIALRWPVRRIAAAAGIAGAGAYLLLSGGNVASERAFIMVCVALGAVMLDRRALTLRAVALAALIVLVLRPEALLNPGFQMSFAATTALVAVFAALREIELPRGPRWLRPVGALILSSGVAGLATAPLAAAHFNIFAQFGLIANLASVPIMGAVIMPACVAALALLPLGLSDVVFDIAGLGIAWILLVADTVAGWEGAVRGIPTPPGWMLPSVAMAGLWLALVQGRGRLAAVPVLAALMVGWTSPDRPDVLIDADGQLVGVKAGDIRALSRDRGGGFVAGIWLENDGLRVSQELAAAGWSKLSTDWDIVHVAGKRAARKPPACEAGRIVVANVPLNLSGDCTVLDPDKLRATGAVALWRDPAGIRIKTAAEVSGHRPWSPKPASQDPLTALRHPKAAQLALDQ